MKVYGDLLEVMIGGLLVPGIRLHLRRTQY
jgi:hypothetical protein